MKIYAPVKSTNGIRASVQFVNGVGETDNPHLIAWFMQHGYEVVDETKVSDIKEVDITTALDVDLTEPIVVKPTEKSFDDMTPNELREWMKEHGYGSQIKNTRNKDKLLEIIRG